MSWFPDDPVRTFLAENAGRTLHFYPKAGNAGDGYIAFCTYLLFNQYGVNFVPHNQLDETRDSLIVIGGGGNLIEGKYRDVNELIKRLSPKNTEVVLLPHTISGNKEIIDLTWDNLKIFCREERSYAHALENGGNPEAIFLSHDLTLLIGELPFAKLVPTPSHEESIEIFRTDSESATPFRVQEFNRDISLSWNGDIWQSQQFCEFVTMSLASYLEPFRAVTTDRLHIAILAAFLDKEVTLLPNNHFKNEAMFEYSLSQIFPKMIFGRNNLLTLPLVEEDSYLVPHDGNAGKVTQSPPSPFYDWTVDESFIQRILEEAKSTKSVSFDIFDTALTRIVDSPVDVFAAVASKLEEIFGNDASNFGASRERAEQVTRHRRFEECRAEDVTFDEIYNELESSYGSSEIVATAKKLELSVEADSLLAVPEILRLSKLLQEEGIPYFFVSDMYLPQDFLAEVLTTKGYRDYSDLYVSNVVGKTKHTGHIWNVVGEKWNLASHLHIGDDFHADIDVPRSMGISTSQFSRVISSRRTRHSLTKETVPFSKSFRFRKLVEEGGQDSINDSHEIWTRLGGSLGTLVIGSFVRWLNERVQLHRIERLFFLSRDGYAPFRAWNELNLSELSGIEATYLPVSRKVLNLSAGFIEADTHDLGRTLLSFLSASGPGVTVKVALDRAGLLNCQDLCQSSIGEFGSLHHLLNGPDDVRRFQSILNHHSDEILEQLEVIYNATVGFLKQEGLFSPCRKALVDTGWHGTMQASISRLGRDQVQDFSIVGFYYGLWPQASGNRYAAGFMESCFGSDFVAAVDQLELSESVAILEELHSAPHGSVDGYELSESGTWVPLFQERPHEKLQYEQFIRYFQEAALEGLNNVYRLEGPIYPDDLTPQVGLNALGSVFVSPNCDELDALSKLSHSATFDHLNSNLIVDRRLPLDEGALWDVLGKSEWKIGQALLWLQDLPDTEHRLRQILVDFLASHFKESPRLVGPTW